MLQITIWLLRSNTYYMKRGLIKKILLILCLFGASYSVKTYSATGYSVPVSMKDGLNNNTVYDIHYSADGFVWFATDMGISRYDGFRIRNFPLMSSKGGDAFTPVSRAVCEIMEGTDGLFYLRLLEGGMVCFDSVKEKFLPVSFNGISHDFELLSFCPVSRGQFYLGTTTGLYSGTMRPDENGDSVIISLSEEQSVKGAVSQLTSTEEGVIFACVNRTKVVAFDISSAKAEYLKNGGRQEISKLYWWDNYLWICFSYTNIELYNLKQKSFHRPVLPDEYRNFLLGTCITDVVSSGTGDYFVATWNGLLSLNFKSTDLGRAACSLDYLNQQAPHPMKQKITNLLWNEKWGMLWVGTFGNGLFKMYKHDKTFYSLDKTFNSEVVRIEEDQKGYVWILTDKGELLRSTSNNITIETSFLPWTKGLKRDETYRMYKDRNGILWLGDTHGGVVSINPFTEEVTVFALLPQKATDFSEAVYAFCLDSRNRMWVVTASRLLLFDYKKNESRIVHLEYEGRKIKKVNSIEEDKEGNIWLGTDIGLKRMEVVGKAVYLFGDYEQSAGLEVSPVYSIYVNSYNQILASYTDKVVRIDGREKNKVEKVFTLLNGLSSSHVFCMVDDNNGNTWVGSNSGVMTIRNDQDILYNYASFGYSKDVCRLHNGLLLWASSLGLSLFDPQVVKVERHNGNLKLSEVWINGEAVSVGEKVNGRVVLSVTPNRQNDFVLGAGSNRFTFYFSDLKYGIMQCKQAYRLQSDEEWKIGRLEDGVSFKNLSPDDYVLQVKLIYPDASESEITEIPFSVRTYWWNSFWLKLFGALSVLLLSYGIYNYIVRKGKRRNIHRARERALREKLNLVRVRREKESEIEMMRNQLLRRFVEELRTPLSLIMAPLKEMSREQNLPAGTLSKLHVAYRNSLGMLDACDQLLAIYTQGSLSDKLKVAPYAVDRLVDKAIFPVSELMRINRIDFKCDKRIKKDMEVWVDRERINFVLRNLLTNAFNHIRFSGVVRLLLQEIVRDGVRYCIITVEDNGKSRVSTVDKGLRPGLADVELGYGVMEKILQLHHGAITLKSSEGEGTEVIVELPATKEILQDDSNILFIEPEAEDVQEEKDSLAPEQLQEVPVPVPEDTVRRMASVSEPSATPPVCKERKTLLIIEDHKDIRLYLKILFGKEYDLLIATNGQEGVDMAIKELPDLILCDIMMPVKDGFECCREVKENLDTCNIPFIMLTAKVEDEDVIHGLELGADDYILKPFTPGILQAKVRNQINARMSLKQMYTNLLMPPGDNVGEVDDVEEKVKKEDPFIASVVKIIEDNMCEADFSVRKLAQELNMSQPTLYRKVKQSTDFTIIELIRGVRMRKAAVLLKQKMYAVQEVAEMVGYNDIPTFRKHFVDTFGTTPSTYPNSENT